MGTEFVIDTHALVWFLQGDARLGLKARAVLEDPGSKLVLPAIALAEACHIVERGRTSIPSSRELLKAVGRDRRIRVAPLTRAIVRRTVDLGSIPEMHDRQIAATALRIIDRGGDAILLTKDERILASGIVPVIW
ncbi:MAG: hypothetical protein AVDCRST_MAG64-3423 [uncultured Phycisphaerae bacterium]|uniref:PIN domain-containing protein n=1 Tax=uncultured Phycisphaerae bacterium TaxID=904963 RepID=A0A6J4Q475_9BACT|nr:MAG: hypothetical protein AVDCRST_MAG64-3423 [uncultured Phycisphaerae bacterium]